MLSSRRPTQYNESEVYVCVSLFDEGKRLILPLVGGAMKRSVHGLTDTRYLVWFYPDIALCFLEQH